MVEMVLEKVVILVMLVIIDDDTLIILNKEYLDMLSSGNHTLKVQFNDNGVAITNFTVKRDSDVIKNPNTSDNIAIQFAMLGASIIGMTMIIGYILISKKRRKNNV